MTDDRFEYRVGGVPIPEFLGDWAVEILSVAWRTRLTIFAAGALFGLFVAAVAVLAGLWVEFLA